MAKRLVIACLSIALLALTTTTLSGCSFLKSIPFASVSRVIQDASLILDQIESFAGTFFKLKPNAEKEEAVSQAVQRARNALIVAQRAAKGTEDLANEDYLAAIGDFRAAYDALTQAMAGVPGFSVAKAGETSLRTGPGQLVVPEPLALLPQE